MSLASLPLLFGPVVLPRLARCTHIELTVFLLFYFLASATHDLFSEACCLAVCAGEVTVKVSSWRPLVGWRLICRRASSEK